ncbi:Uu.00g024870.m01.CDS01 [Anthostomella pinea]|uniref:mRNA-capping enzyme subunit beta n=1 Tax=Anthostomella pinea TaxID=933095 RepID=A0AAI8YA19_9PEZI|nr:Uu.00g024870.m01.CDS01 [Anthostomella pinea]
MDLRSILTTEGGAAAAAAAEPGGRAGASASSLSKPPPPPPPSLSMPTSATGTANPAAPATPVQAGPPSHAFRDYSHSTHASPIAQHAHVHDYSGHNPSPAGPGPGHGPYASPTSYHPPANVFVGRPPVPPLQPPGSHDPRSPGSATLSGPSPYRQTPTSSVSASSGGYPFPSAQQPPASPGQRHLYGPATAYSRDSYPPPPPQASALPPVGVPSNHASISYMQGQQPQQPMPQTPPVGTPGGSHQYLHQRSLSMRSTPTPSSAHSQHAAYGPPYAQGSPITSTHHPPSHLEQHHPQHPHQLSQPPTPLGPPMPGPPRQSPATAYQQPPSPYQQRMPSTTASYPPNLAHSHTSPPPPAPASISRMSSAGHNTYDAVAESHRRSQSQQSRSERERSVSVSPKTRVPSIPSSTGQHVPSIGGEPEPYHSQPPPQPPTNSVAIMDAQRDATPAKRKLDDRDLRPDELENHRQPPPAPRLNGNHGLQSQAIPQSSTSPMMPRRKRVTHSSPPVWAQCGRGRALNASRNFSIKQNGAASIGASTSDAIVNGNHQDAGGSVKSEQLSRHNSPEATRSVTTVKAEEPTMPAPIKDAATFEGRPFPWEPSIENVKPFEVVSRSVADFIYLKVMNNPNHDEMQTRGVQYEIEAKLGTIIDKATNERIDLRIHAGECIIGEDARIAFRSSMTENQHRGMNEYLNEQVKASFPRHPNAASRVPVHYVHRREVDRFYELPAQMRQRLPACVANLLQPNSALKARVSYDQKTGDVIAKIVKARVGDIHIHLPHMLLDCRISINMEWDWEGTADEIEHNQVPNKERFPDRNKDRLSYKHGFYSIDLTQVTQGTQGSQPQMGANKEHELEVELDSTAILEHGRRIGNGEPSRYTDLVDGLVDNVRVLARRCPQPA